MSRSLSIVIDADIARSSGLTQHPISSGSRALLENVLNNGHKVALCSDLRIEWGNHKSLFAKRWLASMIAKRRVDFITPVPIADKLIDDNISDEKKFKIAKKDSHLIDAAIISDKIIASNDDTARGVFCELTYLCGDLNSIIWFNAISDREFVSSFLDKKCHVPVKYNLGIRK